MSTDHGTPRHRGTETIQSTWRLGVSVSRCAVASCVVAIAVVFSTPAAAQTSAFSLRGFADVGSTTFTATESFTAVLGDDRGAVAGGGVEAVVARRVFVNLRASRFREEGERVFLFGGEQFNLGIPTTVTVRPVELTGGYRFDFGGRVVPYAGAGLGWHRYEETSEFAEADENVDDTYRGYHVLGGAEVRLANWLGAAAEAQWATVPDALGLDPNGVSAAFDESDLGGVTFRVKIVIGR
jgi:opacity protein-like surface antigen